MLACNLFRIFDLIKQEQETFRLIIFLSDNRKQRLYSVNTKKRKILFLEKIFYLNFLVIFQRNS
jgi:hypothetical protein